MKKIGLVVPDYLRNNLQFDVLDAARNRDDILEPFAACREFLLKRGVLLETSDCSPLTDYDAILFFCHDRVTYLKVSSVKLLPRSIYVAWEPPTVDPAHDPSSLRQLAQAFGKVLTWNEDLLGEPEFERIRYAQSSRMWDMPKPPFAAQVLLANISGNKTSKHPLELYTERKRILRHFQDRIPDQLAIYGPGWDASEFPSYRGLASSKAEAYSCARFALCFENMRGVRGYITEKIFDCFRSGIVPVYLGAPDIGENVPKDSFIAYDPKDGPEALRNQLTGIDEMTHAQMLERGREAALALATGPFSATAFAHTLESAMDALAKDQRKIGLVAQLRYHILLLKRALARRLR